MSAIDAAFDRCRSERRAAFIPYLTAGDPDLDRFLKIIDLRLILFFLLAKK